MKWKIKCTILLHTLIDITPLELIHHNQYKTNVKTEFSLKINELGAARWLSQLSVHYQLRS